MLPFILCYKHYKVRVITNAPGNHLAYEKIIMVVIMLGLLCWHCSKQLTWCLLSWCFNMT